MSHKNRSNCRRNEYRRLVAAFAAKPIPAAEQAKRAAEKAGPVRVGRDADRVHRPEGAVMHKDGNWMNDDQRDSHPEPFVFIDDNSRPYKALRWGGKWWLFYWHAAKKWVSLRPVTGDELRLMRQRALPPEQAKLYDDLHAKNERA